MTQHSIMTFDYYTILICLNKLIVQNYLPDGMEKFMFTMR